MKKLLLAKVMDRAATIRENSWQMFVAKPLEGGVYRKTMQEATIEAFNYIEFKDLDRDYIPIVSALLTADWNGSLAWALKICRENK